MGAGSLTISDKLSIEHADTGQCLPPPRIFSISVSMRNNRTCIAYLRGRGGRICFGAELWNGRSSRIDRSNVPAVLSGDEFVRLDGRKALEAWSKGLFVAAARASEVRMADDIANAAMFTTRWSSNEPASRL